MNGRRARLAGVALATLAGLVAVLSVLPGPARDGARASAGPVKVRVGERTIEVSGSPVRAGRVVFEERNEGRRDHDTLLVRTDRPPDELPLGLAGPAPEVAGKVIFGQIHDHSAGHGPGDEHLAPRAVRRRVVTLRPGRYVLICPLPGHYAGGQRAGLVVE